MKIRLKGKYTSAAALGIVSLLTVLLFSGRSQPAALPAGAADKPQAELDTAAEQVRALAGELVERDRRLEELAQQLGELRGDTVAIAAFEPASRSAPAPETEAGADGDPQLAEHLPAIRSLLQTISARLVQQQADVQALPEHSQGRRSERLLLTEASGAAEPAETPQIIWYGTRDESAPLADDDRDGLLIPPGTTIGKLRLITSLIGRIPTSNQVTSPLPFKALVEASAIAAPGFDLPELRGALVSGQAVGDLLLRCVRARITDIVLIGSDGHYARAQAEAGDQLGYLSDPLGNPCLRGQLVSDFPRALLAAGLASGVEAGAGALAQQQLAGQLGPNGSYRILGGDAGEYLTGTALAGSAQTLSEWIRQRAGDSFDAVTLQSGVLATAHITREVVLAGDDRRIGWQLTGEQQ